MTRKLRRFEIRRETSHVDRAERERYIRDTHVGYSEGVSASDAIARYYMNKAKPSGIRAIPAKP
jgi:hypothetical protein